ncbi:Spy0128 family protein [Hespellia stercorisuis]|uniref:LPXTG-motif cell wall anchor domain-containing protein/pilin isopeptide linkage domain-containing protein n=1 Tax=Hespellia stercorisuis DSM 15480 TaxID=1121950 RepID=A0A1M6UMS3_9FIRM|nr:FctA domain-containing protein [Hespellia stercorisuis]SHK70433.1 LPXTG-motif cell wall anchor domain-containing protein/pilin isopeptide linkage domain-containing protein [Hespellia stercorisuis DSM 15480]
MRMRLNKRLSSGLSLLLVVIMVCSTPVSVYAASTETPAVETSATETETPTTETPETETPETEKPETETPETEKPETETPETEKPETETPETEKAETEKPETETAETEKPETEKPETETLETEKPETEKPTTEEEDVQLLTAGAPIEVSDTNNYIQLDSSNDVLKTPEDFGIGKRGEYQFGVKFTFTPQEISDEDRVDVAAEFIIPANFTVTNMPTLSGVTYTKKTNSDGSTTIIAKCQDGIVTAATGQFYITQNAEKLITDLPNSGGTYNFDMKMYAHYGKDNQTDVIVKDSDKISRLILQGDTTTPSFTIKNVSDDYTWMPGEITRAGSQDLNVGNGIMASAADDAFTLLSRDALQTAKGFKIEYHKSAGYLADGTTMEMILPEEDKIFIDKGLMYVSFTTDSGTTIVLKSYDWNTAMGSGTDDAGTWIMNGAKAANTMDGSDYKEMVSGTGLSYTDILSQPGTFTLNYYPTVYYNRLYQGDWSKTIYSAASGSTVTYTNLASGGSEKTEGSPPLKFTFIQGDKEIAVSLEHEVNLASTDALLSQISQYTSSSNVYKDSDELMAKLYIKTGKNFQIQDNLQLSYDYEEALSPIWMGSLKTAKVNGMTYRIYVTDATTGAVVRIETLVDEETFAAGYTPKTIDGITETVIDGTSLTEWSLAEANTAGNKNYVSRIEVLKEQYEYNVLGSQNQTTWFTYKLRAYHAKLSDGTDIPDAYKAKIHREMTSDQIQDQKGAALTKDYTVTTNHLKDTLKLRPNGFGGSMEVNNHEETGRYFAFEVMKYNDTMDYNIDSEGNTIAYGQEGYNPVVIEVAGEAVTMTDRMSGNGFKPLGVWGDDGKYYDLLDLGIDADDYTKTIWSKYSDTKETASGNANHNSYNAAEYTSGTTRYYDLKALYQKLGIQYGTKWVITPKDVNSWNPGGDLIIQYPSFYINKVEPGYLNYDGVIGTNGSADLPKTLKYDTALYCEYSDYKSEIIEGNESKDSNGGTIHGTKNAYKNMSAAKLVEGDGVTGVSVHDADYYVNPHARIADRRGNLLSSNMGPLNTEIDQERLTCNTLESAADNGLELTQIRVAAPTNSAAIIQYQDAVIDFTGTDKDLLSLTNSISFPLNGWVQFWSFTLDYTLSNGEKKSITSAANQSWGDYSEGRMYYMIPGVDIANGVYVTELKVGIPNGLNWGDNSNKLSAGVVGNYDLPSIGLSMIGVNIPDTYSASGKEVGTMYTDETDSSKTYDKLDVKAALTYKNIFGEIKTESDAFTTTGKSERIAGQRAEIAQLRSTVTYGKSSTNQGDQVQVSTREQFSASDGTHKMIKDNNVLIRPTYYYKIAKDFTYVEGSISRVPDGATVNFIPAGTGEGKSGDAGYGYLVVSFDGVADENLVKASGTATWIQGNAGWIPFYEYNVNFKLQVAYDAETITQTPVAAVMMDTPYDANRDGKGPGNATGILVETCNDYNQLVDNGPYGDVFGNTTTAKNSNKDKSAEMLYTEITATHKILEQSIQGVVPYAIATHPYQESTTSVTSKDMTAVENLYSEKVYMTGDDKTDTNDWEVYIPITKQGERYSYVYGGQTRTTDANEFAMDLLDVDTSDMDAKTLDYVVWYTTDSNPGTNGYAGAKGANWAKWKDRNGVIGAPADLSEVTMVKVTVDSIQTKEKVNFQLNYKLHEHKSQVGTQTNNAVFYANFTKEGKGGAPYFGDVGQTSLPMQYIMTDMSLTGYVWDESDYDSLYEASDSTGLYAGAEMKLLDANNDNAEVVQTGNSANVTGANGKYTLLMPHDGTDAWNVQIILPDGKKLVNYMSDVPSTDETVSSAFNRKTNLAKVSFTADSAKNSYTRSNVNAGIYTKPSIAVSPEDAAFKVGTKENEIKTTVTNTAPGISFATIGLKPGEDTTVATIDDSKNDGNALVEANKTGVVTGVASVDDGYGGKITREFQVTIYANVQYDANEGTGTAPTDDTKYFPTENDTVTVKDADKNVLKRPGHNFAGWNTKADGEGTTYHAGDTFEMEEVKEDVTLYAVWDKYPPVTETPGVTKILAGQTPVEDSDFTFLLEGQGTAAMPAESAEGKKEIQITGAGTANFGEISFTEAGTYVYKITEADGGSTGYSYSDEVYTMTVQVIDNGTSYDKVTTITNKDNEVVTSGVMSFTNTYTPEPAKVTAPEVSKKLTGADRPEEKEFTFNMTPVGNAPEPENTTARVSGAGTASAFGKITFTAAGTYLYNITETQGTANGYTYDDSIYQYEVVVTDDHGTLKTSEKSYRGTGDAREELGEEDSVVFTNNYAVASGTYTVPTVTKAIDGPAPDNKTFTFTITGREGTEPMPMTDGKETTEVTTAGAGLANFGEITFEKAGIYVYEVKETAGTENGYTYDDSVYTVAVNVTDNGGQLEAVGTVTKGEETADAILFTNKYETRPVTVDPPVEKKISGDTPSEKETFTFQMKAADPAFPMPEGSEEGVKLAAVQGAGKVEFGEYTYTSAGTYSYTISEVAGTNKEYTYDKTVYTLTDVVTDENGTLVVTRTIADGDGADSKSAVFTNKYTKTVIEPENQDNGNNTVVKPGNQDNSNNTVVAFRNQDNNKTTFANNIIEIVKTGDSTAVGLLALILLLSAGAIVLIVRKRRETK